MRYLCRNTWATNDVYGSNNLHNLVENKYLLLKETTIADNQTTEYQEPPSYSPPHFIGLLNVHSKDPGREMETVADRDPFVGITVIRSKQPLPPLNPLFGCNIGFLI